MKISSVRVRLPVVFALLLWLSAPAVGQPVFLSQPQKASKQAARTQSPDPTATKASQQLVDETVPEDPALKHLVDQYGASLRVKLSEMIAQAPEEIRRGRGGGSLGLIIADAMRFEAARVSKRPVVIAISNTGGLRSDLPAGNITLRDVFTIMPFENQLVVLDMTGEQLLTGCERVAARFKERGGFPVSGIKLTFKDGKLLHAEVKGVPIDPKASYTVATSDYLYSGGDGYNFSQGKNYVQLGVTLRDAIISYFRNIKTITVPKDPRFVDETPEGSNDKPQSPDDNKR